MNGLATAGRQLEELAQIGIQMEEQGAAGEHMKAMWAGQSNVLVSVRVRPLMKHDVVKKSCARVLDSKVVIILDPAANDKVDILRANRSREKQYAFDYVFEPGSSQESVYHHTTKFLIHGVLDGFNATVFAYGQTGSGKTYTMIGTENDPGIMVRVMGDLFVHSEKQGKEKGVYYKVSVSFIEIYNENIRDLLSDIDEYLDLREDPIKGPVVASITEIETSSGRDVMKLLHQGNERRSQAATAANEVSSRSHAVLQVLVESRDRAPGVVANIKVGKLSLVDLAGSERAANTKNRGARLVEGANINRSLLALGNCINALGEKGNKGNFVPYRDSKLTRLLKDSLGGNCRTVMIANISCAESAFEETLNTLKYANRAKNIKTNVQRNVLNVNYHISEYVQLIDNLRGEIQQLKSQIGSQPPPVGQGFDGIAAFTPGANINRNGLGSPIGGRQGGLNQPATPLNILRESLRSANVNGIAGATIGGEGREIVNNMRNRIVENFQERMQLRRSLIELEDQNVQNNIEVSKRQLIVVQWSEKDANLKRNGVLHMTKQDFAAYILANSDPEITEAWMECEQLRKAILKNNNMKKNIAKRLRHNEREAEKFRDELGDKITGEDRRELMELQYQVGRLELENMELEQHRIVHESILKGKDLVIQKLQLQLAVRDRVIQRQQHVLSEYDLDNKVGYSQLALLQNTLMGEPDPSDTALIVPPPSPPRNMADMSAISEESQKKYSASKNTGHSTSGSNLVSANIQRIMSGSRSTDNIPRLDMKNKASHGVNVTHPDLDEDSSDEYDVPYTDRRSHDVVTARDRIVDENEWAEVQEEAKSNNPTISKVQSTDRLHSNANTKQDLYHQALIPGGNAMSNGTGISRSDSKDSVGSNRGGKSRMITSMGTNNNNNTSTSTSTSNKAKNDSSVGTVHTKGIHGPRGGRHFRSSLGSDENIITSNATAPTNNNSNISNANSNNSANHRIKKNYDQFQIEGSGDSDDESVNSRQQQLHHQQQQQQHPAASQRHKKVGGNNISPRYSSSSSKQIDKLEPIPLPKSHSNVTPKVSKLGNYNNASTNDKHNSSDEILLSARSTASTTHQTPRKHSNYDNNNMNPIDSNNNTPLYPIINNANAGNSNNINNFRDPKDSKQWQQLQHESNRKSVHENYPPNPVGGSIRTSASMITGGNSNIVGSSANNSGKTVEDEYTRKLVANKRNSKSVADDLDHLDVLHEESGNESVGSNSVTNDNDGFMVAGKNNYRNNNARNAALNKLKGRNSNANASVGINNESKISSSPLSVLEVSPMAANSAASSSNNSNNNSAFNLNINGNAYGQNNGVATNSSNNKPRKSGIR